MYLLLNLLLVLTTVAAGFWVSSQDAAGRWQADRLENPAVPLPPAREARANTAAAPLDFQSTAAMDELWQRTLFRPERTDDQSAAAMAADEPAVAPTDMEFVGMGRFDARAAAIIIVREVPQRPLPGRPRAKAASSGQDRRPKVYAVGEEVGSTGYLVKEINFNEVLLVKGNEERVLTLDAGDDGTRVRTDSEIRDRQARVLAVHQEAVKPGPAATTEPDAAAEGPGPPPPPPPPPPLLMPTPAPGSPAGAARATPADSLTRQARIDRARAIREKLLERQNRQNTRD